LILDISLANIKKSLLAKVKTSVFVVSSDKLIFNDGKDTPHMFSSNLNEDDKLKVTLSVLANVINGNINNDISNKILYIVFMII